MISDQSFFQEKVSIPKQSIQKLFDGNLFIKSKKKEFWKSRFFELYQDKLKIYKNGRDKQECSTIFLGNVYLDLQSDEKFPITLIQDGKKLVLHARCQESRDKWILYLKQTCILNVYRESYVNLKVLGKGTFAKVLLAERKQDKKQFAVKTFMKSQDKYKLSLLNEINVLRVCDHPNIIKLYEIHESQEYIYMIMELLEGGELYETIIKNGSFQEKIIAKIMFKIFDALEYLHKRQIMHRDLKPENIVLKDQDYDIKLVDFGLAAFFNSDQSSKRCGTPGYVAPEILEDQKYDEKVDVFSAGVILYVLLSGTSPFYAENLDDILEKNRECNIDFQIKGVSKEAKELLQLTLSPDPKQRISATQALNHKFITQYYTRQCETIEDEEPIIDEQHNDNFSAFENMKKFQSESYKLNKAKPSLIQQTPLMGKRDQIQNDSWLQEKSPIIQIQQQQSPPKETLTIFTTNHSRKSSIAQKSAQEIEKKKASMVRNYLKKMDI
ncbi:hypothetical protein pb186bvf_010673 [Paramecium bursaria]